MLEHWSFGGESQHGQVFLHLLVGHLVLMFVATVCLAA